MDPTFIATMANALAGRKDLKDALNDPEMMPLNSLGGSSNPQLQSMFQQLSGNVRIQIFTIL